MPASMQSIPTNLHNQDVIPLGNQAALRALDQARLLQLLVGSLAVGLRQAAYVGARPPTAPGCAAVLAALVAAVPPIDPDRPLDVDATRAVLRACATGAFTLMSA